MSSKRAEPRPKKTDAQTQFAFLGRSAAGRRMTVAVAREYSNGLHCEYFVDWWAML